VSPHAAGKAASAEEAKKSRARSSDARVAERSVTRKGKKGGGPSRSPQSDPGKPADIPSKMWRMAKRAALRAQDNQPGASAGPTVQQIMEHLPDRQKAPVNSKQRREAGRKAERDRQTLQAIEDKKPTFASVVAMKPTKKQLKSGNVPSLDLRVRVPTPEPDYAAAPRRRTGKVRKPVAAVETPKQPPLNPPVAARPRPTLTVNKVCLMDLSMGEGEGTGWVDVSERVSTLTLKDDPDELPPIDCPVNIMRYFPEGRRYVQSDLYCPSCRSDGHSGQHVTYAGMHGSCKMSGCESTFWVRKVFYPDQGLQPTSEDLVQKWEKRLGVREIAIQVSPESGSSGARDGQEDEEALALRRRVGLYKPSPVGIDKDVLWGTKRIHRAFERWRARNGRWADVELTSFLQKHAAYRHREPGLLLELNRKGDQFLKKECPGMTEEQKTQMLLQAVTAAMVPSPEEESGRQYLKGKDSNKRMEKASGVAEGNLGVRGFFRTPMRLGWKP